MTSAAIAIDGLPEAVNARLNALVPDLRFWVDLERKRPAPAEARDALRGLEQGTLDLLTALDALHATPRAHIVANLPAGALHEVRAALAALHAAAAGGVNAMPARRGNAEVGVPRLAAERVVGIFNHAGLPATVTNNELRRADKPITQALKAVLAAAGHPLGTSAANKYLISAS